jgi:RNA polymerase sigma factor (sigma-70 family)
MGSPQEEFLAFTQQYRGVIVSAIRRVCGTTSDRLLPDVEQDVYLALWQRWNDGHPIDYPVSYLYKVAMRTALAVMRTYRTADVDESALEASPTTELSLTINGFSAVERACLLTELLGQLPPEHARAVRAYLAGFSYTETAALYGWSASVARHRIYRGLQALKAFMMQESV